MVPLLHACCLAEHASICNSRVQHSKDCGDKHVHQAGANAELVHSLLNTYSCATP